MTWQQRFGGCRWRVTEDGVEIEGRGYLRTAGAPITMTRIRRFWDLEIGAVSTATGVPPAILMMTLANEGAVRWQGDRFAYPLYREEPGFISDDATPDRVSIGPMHILLSNFRWLMQNPTATRKDAANFLANLFAGALYIRRGVKQHDYDPVLVSAIYNAGSLKDASNPKSKYHNPFHLRAYDPDGPEGPAEDHLTRAVRWYNDAVVVLRDDPFAEMRPVLALPAKAA